jgi:hypothetical protein
MVELVDESEIGGKNTNELLVEVLKCELQTCMDLKATNQLLVSIFSKFEETTDKIDAITDRIDLIDDRIVILNDLLEQIKEKMP